MDQIYRNYPGTYTDHTVKQHLDKLTHKVEELAEEIKATRKLMQEHDAWERKEEYIEPSKRYSLPQYY